MSRLIAGSPDALLVAARVLEGQGGGLRHRARRLGGAAHVSGWEGAASLSYATRARQVQRSLVGEAEQLAVLARSTASYAERLRSAQRQADLLQRRQERARAELHRLDATPCRRGVDPAHEARRASLGQEVGVLQARLDTLADSAQLDAQTFARVLAFDPTALLPGWALGALALKGAVLDGRKLIPRSRLVGAMARDVARAKWVLTGGNVTEWLAHLEKADRAVEQLRHGRGEPGWAVRHLPARAAGLLEGSQRVAGRAFLPLTVKDGVADVVTGGGYQDWREPATRVMGGVGAASALTLLVASGGTVAVVAGAGLLAYSAWKLGNAAWDHRHEIAEFGRGVKQLAQRGFRVQQRLASRAGSWAVRRAADTVREAGHDLGRALRTVHLPRPPWPSFP
ncbi:MAG TPA: hypothetical protein VFL99_07805 [Segeticoccus sp.]|uniref:hypothetical protein n=1 Tax=Segeticoccus sp. TaxID=2706531 RepID=UPI002D80561B|nr:hypothetical protein [Segeticoccus sp.]HET8600215.1 hypothetical protein [Segeticoccus sp.]